MKGLCISQWAVQDRPTWKLANMGVNSLTNSELLSIILNKGTHEMNVVELSQLILSKSNNNLNTLGKISMNDLMTIRGIGIYKAAQVIAAIELGKRRQLQGADEKVSLCSSNDIYNMMHPIMQDMDHEEAWILLMNNNYKLLGRECISSGGLTETAVDARVIMRSAILAKATIIVLIHNHPSNNPSPSMEDDRITTRVSKACELMRIYFLDHIVMTDGRYYSYKDKGRL